MKLNDITPSDLLCRFGACPAILKTANASYVIIGKLVGVTTYPELTDRIGPGECAVEVSAEFLRAALGEEALGDVLQTGR
jgi:hypothetical protein